MTVTELREILQKLEAEGHGGVQLLVESREPFDPYSSGTVREVQHVPQEIARYCLLQEHVLLS